MMLKNITSKQFLMHIIQQNRKTLPMLFTAAVYNTEKCTSTLYNVQTYITVIN